MWGRHLFSPQLPSTSEAVKIAAAVAVWLGVTLLFLPVRPEHWLLAATVMILFFFNGTTRRLVVALIPFVVFGISYDWMNIWHNYELNEVDIRALYEAEKSFFGIWTDAGLLTPNEFFATHHALWVDLLAGFFYLCWVPVPIAFGIWLYAKGQRAVYLHFALVFLLVNLIGFALYYVHPAAPPWYVDLYGFDFIEGVPGNVAGLGRFDEITGWHVFDGLYARNSNVFAAFPSLHSAYMPIAFFYSLKGKCPVWMRIALCVLMLGIWFTAVYSSHHYLIDVIGGALCAAIGILIFEVLLMRISGFKTFIERYTNYISKS